MMMMMMMCLCAFARIDHALAWEKFAAGLGKPLDPRGGSRPRERVIMLHYNTCESTASQADGCFSGIISAEIIDNGLLDYCCLLSLRRETNFG